MKEAFIIAAISAALFGIAYVIEYFTDRWYRFNICAKHEKYTYDVLDLIKIITISITILSSAIWLIKLCLLIVATWEGVK